MARWHSLEPVDDDFFTSAPHIIRFEEHFAAPPAKVWEALVSDESLAAWGPVIKKVTWTSPRPFGVGTTREVSPPGAPPVRERYYRWDEGRSHAFYVYESTLPLFKRFAEDYRVEPDGDGTRFTWVTAIEAKPAFTLPVRLIAPVLKVGFGKLVSDGKKYFAKGH